MDTITRRDFLRAVPALAAMPLVADAAEPKVADYDYDSAHIHVGILLQPLRKGGRALVKCPNPYHPKCYTGYEVCAGKFVSETPWPVGHPVAFTSVDGQFVTIGW